MKALPKPDHRRKHVNLPVPVYGGHAYLALPADMTDSEARKIAAVVLAYARITSFNAEPNAQVNP